jgi:hypothetical protein
VHGTVLGCAFIGPLRERWMASALKIYPRRAGLIHLPHRLYERIFNILETNMKKKSEPEPRAKTKQSWSLSAFTAYALEALAAVKRKKADENVRPMPDRDNERS